MNSKAEKHPVCVLSITTVALQHSLTEKISDTRQQCVTPSLVTDDKLSSEEKFTPAVNVSSSHNVILWSSVC